MRNKGVVLIFVLLTIIPLIGLIGLIVDIGRYYILSRQLQNAADSAALAGAHMLRSCDPNNTCSVPHKFGTCTGSRGGWLAVKPAISRMISKQRFLEGDMSSFYDKTWEDGHVTFYDSDKWSRTSYESGKGSGADLEVAVNRWQQCYEDDTGICDKNKRKSIEIDEIDDRVKTNEWIDVYQFKRSGGSCAEISVPRSSYCLANAVTVNVRHPRGITLFFIKLFMPGFDPAKTKLIEKKATAVMRYPWCHGLPKCQEAEGFDSSTLSRICPTPNPGNPTNSWPGPCNPMPTPTPVASGP